MTELLAGAWAPIHLALWEKLGYDTRAVLDHHALADLLIAQNRIPISLELRGLLFDALAAQYQDPLLGLRTGAIYNPLELGVLGYAILSSPTIAAALKVCARYFSLYSDLVDFDLTVEAEVASLALTPRRNRLYSRHQLEAIVAGLIHSPVTAQFGTLPACQVQFAYEAPCDPEKYQKVLGCPVMFGQPVTAIQFPVVLLQMPLKSADITLHQIHLDLAEQQLQAAQKSLSLREEIKRRMWKLLQEGRPLSIEQLSQQMHASARTLQQKLRREGYSFRQIVQDIRQEMAMKLVASNGMPLQDIHYLLGYTEQSTFYQAFKRWTGHTPGEFRRAHTDQVQPAGLSGKVSEN